MVDHCQHEQIYLENATLYQIKKILSLSIIGIVVILFLQLKGECGLVITVQVNDWPVLLVFTANNAVR